MRTLVMATMGPSEGESEPVIVDTDTHGAIVLELDDGRVLCFDRHELMHALAAPQMAETRYLGTDSTGHAIVQGRPRPKAA